MLPLMHLHHPSQKYTVIVTSVCLPRNPQWFWPVFVFPEIHSDCDWCLSLGTCNPWEFTCGSGECLAQSSVCNRRTECSDGSDERNCSTATPPCAHDYQFQCDNGRCIFHSWLCDGDNDCGDGSDEVTSNCCKEGSRGGGGGGRMCAHVEERGW